MENQTLTPNLIYKVSQGDEMAFREFFDLYYQKLFHVAFYFLRSHELAEEAVADVYYVIWKRRDSLLSIQNIEHYLYTATKNQALHYIRRSNLPEFAPLELYVIEQIPEKNDPEVKLIDKEYQDLIQQAIYSLPEKCREVFRLYHSDRLKHKEIAQLLNISEKTVEAHISRGYERISSYVNKKYSEPTTRNKMISLFF